MNVLSCPLSTSSLRRRIAVRRSLNSMYLYDDDYETGSRNFKCKVKQVYRVGMQKVSTSYQSE